MKPRLNQEYGGSGLTPGEAAVIDLWDAGDPPRRIADRLGVTRAHVRKLIAMYDNSGRDDRRREDAVRAGCRRYEAALAATGKVYA